MNQGAFPPIRRGRRSSAPLSYAQEGLWYLHQLRPGLNAYHVRFLLRLSGNLDVPVLERAIQAVLSRHEILHTVFPARDGVPQQVVLPFEASPLPMLDFSNLTEQEGEARVRQIASTDREKPFDLARLPLLRLTLIKLRPTIHYLVLTAHHNIFDAWSRQVFLHEVSLFYNAFLRKAEAALPELAVQFSDYAIWQREMLQGETLNKLLSYWKGQFSAELPVADLAFDHPRPPVQTYNGKRLHTVFDPELSTRMRLFCRKERITLFMLMLSALDVLVRANSGVDDITIGCPFADRSRREFDGMIGMLLSTLPLRVDLSGDPTFRELLGRARKVALDAFTYQALPFDLLVTEINPVRDLSRTPLFQVMLNMAQLPKQHLEMQGVLIEELFFDAIPAAFDLEVEVMDRSKEVEVSFRYNTDLFDEATVQRMLAHYRTILAEALASPDRRLSELSLLSPHERRTILYDWNETQTGGVALVGIHQLIEAQVERSPEATAVLCNDQQASYDELNRRANRLAHFLRDKGAAPETGVGIYLERSVDMLVAQLGVLKAGAAYLPLDLRYPPERIRFMLMDAKPSFVITTDRLATGLPAPTPALIRLDGDREQIAKSDDGNPEGTFSPDRLAYVIYTSGSTGTPKGVMLPHRGVVNYLHSMISAHGLGPADRILQITSLSFDPSVRDTLGVLAFGGCVVLMDDAEMSDPGAWLAAMGRHAVTGILSIVPGMLNVLVAAAGQAGFQNKSLRLLMVSGESLQFGDARRVSEVFGDRVKLVNQYGPTECSMIATTHTFDPVQSNSRNGVVPIGRPISNVRVYVLDQFLHPVPIGVPGELFIGGIGVGRGYLNRPELTAERFIPDPFGGQTHDRLYRTGDLARYRPDGTLEFLGRRDFQVKIHGNRVELEEVESVLCQHPSVGEAAVILRQDPPGEARLVAYFVPRNPDQPSTEELRQFLGQRLPAYMIPAFFVPMPGLPRTPNRKVDRRALPAPHADGKTAKIEPRTDTEHLLAGIWQEVLHIDPPGVTDGFFDLGGDSLRAVQLLVRTNLRLSLDLTLQDLFDAPSISALAERIDRLKKA